MTLGGYIGFNTLRKDGFLSFSSLTLAGEITEGELAVKTFSTACYG
jgi:hypothetical protein